MKRSIYVDLSKFYSKDRMFDKCRSLQDVSEEVFEWRCNGYDPGYEIDLDNCYYDIEEAYQYISDKTGLVRADLNKYSEDIEMAFRQAMNDAYWASYEHEWLTKWYNAVVESIYDWIGDKQIYLCKSTKRLQKLPDSWKSPIDTQADTLEIVLTKSDMIEMLGDYREYKTMTWDELADAFYYHCVDDIVGVVTEHIDYCGTLGDSDDWLDYFRDYEEVLYKIKKSIKSHLKRVKAYVTQGVELNYRVASC